MSITATEVVSQFQAVYKPGGQGVKDLMTPITASPETETIFIDKRIGDDTELRGSPAEVTDVLQGYQDQFTRFGDTTFYARKIPLFELKIDVEENPSKLEASWLGFLTGDDIDRKAWPFVRWWLQRLVLPKAQDNWEKKGIFWGEYVAPTPGTPQPVISAVDGIRTQINDAITATDLSPVTLGAVPTDPALFVEYVEAFVEGMDPLVRSEIDSINMSRTLQSRFKRGMRIKYNMNYQQAELAAEIQYGIPVKGFLSHEGSTKIWATIPINRSIGIKKPNNPQVLQLESVKRMVSAYTDYWRGVGFWRWEYFYTNDVDLS